MNSLASSSASLSFGRIASAALASAIFVAVAAHAQQAQGWPAKNSAVKGPAIASSDIADIKCGVSHAIALLKDGTIRVRGVNSPSTGFICSMPEGCDFISIAAGYKHSIALRRSGEIVGAGINASGELNAPAWLTDAVSLAAGDKFSGALRADGTIALWGSPLYGKTVAPDGLDQVVKLSLGQDHGVAMRANGLVRCWGRNTMGQAPAVVLDPTTGAALEAIDVAAGDKHTVALRANGTVYSWGYYKNCMSPIGLADVVSVAAGAGQGIALRANGAVVAWGAPRSNPPAFNNAVKVAAGRAFGYALTDAEGIQAPAVTEASSTKASSCSDASGGVSVTTADAPIRWWTGPNGFFSTREDLSGVGFGRYTLHLRGAGGLVTTEYLVDSDDASTWHADSDGDGFGSGDPASARRDCVQPVGMVSNGDDCDDGNDSLTDGEEFYADTDGDSFGDPETEIRACTPPEGYVENDNDCNDEDSAINPQTVWYRDVDGDGVGSPVDGTKQQCHQPYGYRLGGNDNCPNNPDLLDPVTFYYDGDHDGFGNPSQTYAACTTVPPIGYVLVAGDCNDSNAAINPSAQEVCDPANTDEDCDGFADDADTGGADGKTNWFVDGDSDSYGAGSPRSACDAAANEVATSGDCNDMVATINPGAQEVCDAGDVDQDCDGLADDADTGGAAGKTNWYLDGDSDSWGAGNARSACDAAAGEVGRNGDCNDALAAINPGAQEVCDSVNTDEDCDGSADDADTGGAAGKTNWYVDGDGDTYGAGNARSACDAATNEVATNGDCNDGNAAINPAAQEICDLSNIDEDCDGFSDDADSSATGQTNWYADTDGDTYGAGAARSACDAQAGEVSSSNDCAPTNAAINPGAQEICDAGNIDEDCDGFSDDADSSATGQTNWYADADGDGYGAGAARSACDAATGEVATNSDCAPSNSAINPGAQEICDASNTDEDCDTLADDADSSATGQTNWYADTDGDTYGAGAARSACDAATGEVATNSDCAPSNSAINPGAQEVCDAMNTDEDCDTLADDADSSATGQTNWYADTDGDGYGAGAARSACDAAAGEVSSSNDCAPTNAAINPGAQEVCDAMNTDEDCDGLSDDADSSATGQTNWYADTDGDGYGAGAARSACDAQSGEVSSSNDCAPTIAAINPGAQEICDSGNTDEDCDGLADNNDTSAADAGKSNFYVDGDSDTYGAGPAFRFCDLPSGYSAVSTDCNDSNGAINPGAQEVCDSMNVDEDCDTLADNADSSAADAGKSNFYVDGDSDGYGAGAAVRFCDLPTGYSAVSTDCNDGSAAINPGAQEICDSANTDEDCDTLADNNDSSAADAGKSNFYVDGDSDGYGAGSAVRFCDRPTGYSALSTDCNDASAAINPAATEVCDESNTDENCNGQADNADSGAADAGKSNFYLDTDGDGYGAGNPVRFCDLPPGYSTNANDNCPLEPTLQNPVRYYYDNDNDGYGNSANFFDACSTTPPIGYRAQGGDCVDTNAAINPGAQEVCDSMNVDEDCDTLADNADSSAADAGKSNFYVDADNDSFGAGAAVRFCDQPAGYSTVDTDCNDDAANGGASVYPGAPELCANLAVDNDCDGSTAEDEATDRLTFYRDADGDSFTGSTTALFCSAPAGYEQTNEGDCNDNNNQIYPGAPELCANLAVDNDCDGSTAEDEATDRLTFYRDADGDSFTGSMTGRFCTAPGGWEPTDEGDCNDNNNQIYPGAPELCANLAVDNDCDGSTAEDEATDRLTFYADADHDTFTGSTTGQFCTAPAGYEPTNEGDCNDSNSAIFPGAVENCANDGVDNDCDGEANSDQEAIDAELYYLDADRDGFGYGSAEKSCTPVAGRVTNNSDCDDSRVEYGDLDHDGFGSDTLVPCNGVLNTEDCDDTLVTFPDTDHDGFGYGSAVACGDVTNNSDCYPNDVTYADPDGDGFGSGDPIPCGPVTDHTDCAPNLKTYSDLDRDGFGSDTLVACNGVANSEDCDDDLVTYDDLDDDGFGAGTPKNCGVASNTDCNDDSNATYPGAAELCSTVGTDNNCDLSVSDVDANAADKVDYYRDADSDLFTTAETAKFCPGTTNAGWRSSVSSPLDCNDGSNATYPGAVELCATVGTDNNCDSNLNDVDANASDKVDYYRDADGDSFTTAETEKFCAGTTNDGWRPSPSASLDCNDGSNATYPGAVELCATVGTDNNCDSNVNDVDANASDKVDYYRDADGDLFTTAETGKYCPGTVNAGWRPAPSSPSDCDDESNTTFPGAVELCATVGVDNNCDSNVNDVDANASDKVDYYRDADGDTFTTSQTGKFCPGTVNGGWRPAPSSLPDCDDESNTTFPDAAELCATVGVDNNCNSDLNDVDANASDKVDYYRDSDNDAFTTVQTAKFCTGTANAGWLPSLSSPLDCNDGDNTIYPGAAELCSTVGTDNNCDNNASDIDAGASDKVNYFRDADGDTFTTDQAEKFCPGTVNAGWRPYESNPLDCNDTLANSFPDNPEICADGIDNDCNGEADEDGCIPFELTLEGDVVSIEAGTPVVVSVIANTPPKPVRGVQLVLAFDPTALELDPSAVPVIAPHPDSPLSQVVGAPLIDPVAGTIRYLLVAPTDGPSMTTGAVLCDIHFKALESRCNQAALVRFTEINGFGTQCSALDGGAVTVIVPLLTDLGVIDVDAAAPVISTVPLFDSVIPADAGALSAFVAQPEVTVSDDCDDQVQLVVTGWPEDSRFPIGATLVSWSATDTVGNETIIERTITVGNFQLLDLTVSLEGTVLPTASPRAIRVTAQSNTTVTSVVFNGESVQLSGIVIAPASLNPGCISVKDPAHSLARSVSATVAESGVRYSAAAALRQGDSNDDNKVDVFDYSLWEYDAAVGGSVARDARSNFNGDTVVNLVDRAFVVQSVWQSGDSCSSGFAPPQPVTRISVKELRRMGMGHLAIADRNHDGWVDARDMRVASGAGPEAASGLGR